MHYTEQMFILYDTKMYEYTYMSTNVTVKALISSYK